MVLAEAEEAFDGNDIPVDPWTFSGALLYSITVITTIGECSTTLCQEIYCENEHFRQFTLKAEMDVSDNGKMNYVFI